MLHQPSRRSSKLSTSEGRSWGLQRLKLQCGVCSADRHKQYYGVLPCGVTESQSTASSTAAFSTWCIHTDYTTEYYPHQSNEPPPWQTTSWNRYVARLPPRLLQTKTPILMRHPDPSSTTRPTKATRQQRQRRRKESRRRRERRRTEKVSMTRQTTSGTIYLQDALTPAQP
jgi:hypothetical protein